MRTLFDHLKSRIDAAGPLRLDAYMAEALGHPEHGYYMKGDPLGRRGDFVTAPEVSQMFGELVGLWCATVWHQMGAPSKINLVELGPGRGTLMADFLRAGADVDGFVEALDIHLVETSPALAKRQRHNLSTLAERPTWHTRFEDVPPGPFLLVANELFDALPIRQLEMTAAGWRERLIGLSADGEGLTWVLGEIEAEAPPNFSDAPLGSIAEIGQAAETLMAVIAHRLVGHSGAALVIDYGYGQPVPGDSFQAVKDHAYADPLVQPGEADLTAHVNFRALADIAAAAGLLVSGPLEQGAFLRNLGIEYRAQQLLKAASKRQYWDIDSALKRLIDDGQMGTLFKVLAVSHPAQPRPEGFGA